MNYRRLGRSGLKVSELALGTMNFGYPTPASEAVNIIDAAIDAGINLIDCADVYADGQSEKILGDALVKSHKRQKVLITSKVFSKTGNGPNDCGNTKYHIINACEKSLKQLKTDIIDIYFLHRTDFSVPQKETLEALDLLIRQGKIRYIACSTHPAWRVVEALWIAETNRYPKFICEQSPYNLLDRRIENEILPMCQAYDLGMMTWSPLAQGVLAGRYKNAARLPKQSRGSQKKIFAERITQKGVDVALDLNRCASAKGCTLAQIAVAWILRNHSVTSVIIGPRTLNHLKELLSASKIKLNSEDMKYCNRLVPPGTFVSDHFNTAGWI
ncbi:MAG: aldo/keto reductase [Thermodesulfobacteriota bacterium]|nr:aldo/keto reductase [Thermodesulfobacteriota bacterium]